MSIQLIRKQIDNIDPTIVLGNGRVIYAYDENGITISHKVGDGITPYADLLEVNGAVTEWLPFLTSPDPAVTIIEPFEYQVDNNKMFFKGQFTISEDFTNSVIQLGTVPNYPDVDFVKTVFTLDNVSGNIGIASLTFDAYGNVFMTALGQGAEFVLGPTAFTNLETTVKLQSIVPPPTTTTTSTSTTTSSTTTTTTTTVQPLIIDVTNRSSGSTIISIYNSDGSLKVPISPNGESYNGFNPNDFNTIKISEGTMFAYNPSLTLVSVITSDGESSDTLVINQQVINDFGTSNQLILTFYDTQISPSTTTTTTTTSYIGVPGGPQ